MKLSEIKELLPSLNNVNFQLPDKSFVPEHFHVTEVGMITKNFIDCGGTVRTEKVVNFQLWNANDTDHQLKPEKLLKIIELSEKALDIEDHEIEVEYQTDTIGKYAIDHNGFNFVLLPKTTACLASDKCGTGVTKTKLQLADITHEKTEKNACCTPGGGCC